MVGDIPELVVLSSVRKQTEKASEQHPPWPRHSSCLQVPAWLEFLSSLPSVISASKSPVNPFLPKLVFGYGVLSQQ